MLYCNTVTVATTRRWAGARRWACGARLGRAGRAGSRRALGAGRRAREVQVGCRRRRVGRAGKRAGARRGARHEAATRPLGPVTRQPEAAIRPGSPAMIRHWAGHDTDTRAHVWARLVRWLGQLGAHAASLVFNLGF